MSIINTYDDMRDAILNPEYVVKPVEGLPETFIVTFSAKFLSILESMVELEQIAELKAAGRAYPVYKFIYNGVKIGVYSTLVGGAASAAMLEEIIAMGAKRILFFGSAGALDKEIIGGQLVVPTHAYRDEGVSYHYLPADDYVAVPTSEKLSGILTELHVPHVRARTWTTDAVYRETRRNMLARKAEGCAVVEMECASVMAVGIFGNIPVYQFLYAADCLDASSWDKRMLGNMPGDMRQRILKVAIEAAVRI